MRKFEAIILAGGLGQRFGGGKLLAPYGDGRLIDAAVAAALAAPVEHVVLVTGFDGDAVAAAAMSVATQLESPPALRRVHADQYAEGMAATLRTGIASVDSTSEGVFVFLGDMPHIPPSLCARLASYIGKRSAAAPRFKGVRGHPVLFSARLFPALRTLKGELGARGILDALGDDLALLDVDDPGVVFDVDRPSDMRP